MLRFPVREIRESQCIRKDDMALKFEDEEFNLQLYLSEMRMESKENITRISNKMELGFEKMGDRTSEINKNLIEHELDEAKKFENHDGRIKILEGLHREYKWFIKALIVAAIGAAVKYVFFGAA